MNKYFAPIHIDFFKSEKDYLTNLLFCIDTNRDFVILLFLISQFYYRNRYNGNYSNKITIDKSFNSESCFLKKLKISKKEIINRIVNLEENYFIKNILDHRESIEIIFNTAPLDISDKSKRFSICLDELHSFKYLEHSIIFLLTRFGNDTGYLYHNRICKILKINKLSLPRQKNKIKRIFSSLVKSGHLKSFEYIKGSFKYTYHR